MLNYEVGDEIFLFGFSRGAYTVRSLAGMIRKCGIQLRVPIDERGQSGIGLGVGPRSNWAISHTSNTHNSSK
ncbi:hypothetical protein D9M69_722320 [compost metagenome]